MKLNKKIKEPIESILPKPYEPKRKNRWIVKFKDNEEINAWYLASAQRPKLSHGFLSCLTGYNIADMVIELRDPIGSALNKTLLDIFKNKVKFDFQLEMLDPTGVVVENWEIKKCRILEIDFGELDYSNDGLATITLKIRPKEVKLIY